MACRWRFGVHATIALLIGHAPLVRSQSAGWRLGEICDGVAYNTSSADNYLRGKHLRVADLVWAPFASKDASTPTGWRGLDIDLIDHMSWLLGFTYDVHDMGYPSAGQTWTEHVVVKQYDYDLVMSWWSNNAERRARAVQMKGHLDLSPVLVARIEMPEEAFNVESFTSWAAPFSWQLWLLVVSLVLTSGAVDWFAERDHAKGHKLSSSLYEYTAGVLWGGFEHPLSKTSGLYQIVVVRLPTSRTSACLESCPALIPRLLLCPCICVTAWLLKS